MPTYEPVTNPDELERLGQPRGAKRDVLGRRRPDRLAKLNRPRTLRNGPRMSANRLSGIAARHC